jgi:hypothetical protein
LLPDAFPMTSLAVTLGVGSQKDGTPPSQNHSPLWPMRVFDDFVPQLTRSCPAAIVATASSPAS